MKSELSFVDYKVIHVSFLIGITAFWRGEQREKASAGQHTKLSIYMHATIFICTYK